MKGNYRPLVIILAIVLIPILLWMTPANLVHKLSGACPFSKAKQVQRVDFCLFNSLVSHDDLTLVSLDLVLLGQDLMPSLPLEIVASDCPSSGGFFISVPLRC